MTVGERMQKVHTSDYRHRYNYICTSTTNLQWSNIMNKLQEQYVENPSNTITIPEEWMNNR